MRRARRAGRHLLHYASIASTLVALVVAMASSRAVARADGVDPCRSMLIPVCSLVPILPELDHDVDLTQNPGPFVPAEPDDGPPGPPMPDAGAP